MTFKCPMEQNGAIKGLPAEERGRPGSRVDLLRRRFYGHLSADVKTHCMGFAEATQPHAAADEAAPAVLVTPAPPGLHYHPHFLLLEASTLIPQG